MFFLFYSLPFWSIFSLLLLFWVESLRLFRRLFLFRPRDSEATSILSLWWLFLLWCKFLFILSHKNSFRHYPGRTLKDFSFRVCLSLHKVIVNPVTQPLDVSGLYSYFNTCLLSWLINVFTSNFGTRTYFTGSFTFFLRVSIFRMAFVCVNTTSFPFSSFFLLVRPRKVRIGVVVILRSVWRTKRWLIWSWVPRTKSWRDKTWM